MLGHLNREACHNETFPLRVRDCTWGFHARSFWGCLKRGPCAPKGDTLEESAIFVCLCQAFYLSQVTRPHSNMAVSHYCTVFQTVLEEGSCSPFKGCLKGRIGGCRGAFRKSVFLMCFQEGLLKGNGSHNSHVIMVTCFGHLNRWETVISYALCFLIFPLNRPWKG